MVLDSVDPIALDRHHQLSAILFLEDEMGGGLHGPDQAQG